MATENLSNAIAEQLKLYARFVDGQVDDIAKQVAEEGARQLRHSSPERTGRYAASWRVTKTRNGHYTIHNKDHYRLTHLLEKGHVKVGEGGGRVSARVHIKPVDDFVVAHFRQRLRVGLSD